MLDKNKSDINQMWPAAGSVITGLGELDTSVRARDPRDYDQSYTDPRITSTACIDYTNIGEPMVRVIDGDGDITWKPINTPPMQKMARPVPPPSRIIKENGKVVTPGTKFDQDKLPLNLLSTEALNQVAAVLKFGAIKYAEHNWRGGFKWSRPLAAAMRHITAFNDGEDKDPESGLSHLAHAACCIMFLLEFEKTHKELDDRFKVA